MEFGIEESTLNNDDATMYRTPASSPKRLTSSIGKILIPVVTILSLVTIVLIMTTNKNNIRGNVQHAQEHIASPITLLPTDVEKIEATGHENKLYQTEEEERRLRDLSQFNLNDTSIVFGDTEVVGYAINTTVHSRLATTRIVIDITNDNMDCTVISELSVVLPEDARVTSLSTTSDNGCMLTSEVQAIEIAHETFANMASEGQAAAIIEAEKDSNNYNIQVAIPSEGSSRIELVIEQLLRLKNGKVEFQIPFGSDIDSNECSLELTIEDPDYGVLDFGLFNAGDKNEIQFDTNETLVHWNVTNYTCWSQPRLLRGYFVPGSIPDEGLLLASGKDCFEHIFNPSNLLQSTGAMPRTLVFVIDVSGSMIGQKLEDAKAAFETIISSLTIDDYFTVQTFSSVGTKDIWQEGPVQAMDDAKSQAIEFVRNLRARGSTDINQALLDGFHRALTTSRSSEHVPIVVFLSDGQATVGETNRRAIAANVLDHNCGHRLKLYSLAFGRYADLPLLQALSIQNDGLTHYIKDGYSNGGRQQIESFYESELGVVLLTDIEVNMEGDYTIADKTVSKFSILPAGSELIVRAMIADSVGSGENQLRALTTATTRNGIEQWLTEIMIKDENQWEKKNRCHQSFAHTRIKEILQFMDAVNLLGDQAMSDFSPLKTTCYKGLAQCAYDEALSTALEAQLVWPGLTALVTVENDSCTNSSQPDEEIKLCYDAGPQHLDENVDDWCDEPCNQTMNSTSTPIATDGAFPPVSPSVSADPSTSSPTNNSAPTNGGSSRPGSGAVAEENDQSELVDDWCADYILSNHEPSSEDLVSSEEFADGPESTVSIDIEDMASIDCPSCVVKIFTLMFSLHLCHYYLLELL